MNQTIDIPGGKPRADSQSENSTFDPRAAGRDLAEVHRPYFQTAVGELAHATLRESRTSRQAVRIPERVASMRSILTEAAGRLQNQTSHAGPLSVAGEWLLDNYYIANQALRTIAQDLPPDYERQLPRLPAGVPRVYEIAARITQAESALLDLDRVQRYLESYQAGLPLSMGELWALPIMLRLSILESLVSAITRITQINGESKAGDGQHLEAQPLLIPTEKPDDPLLVENSIRSLRTLAVNDWNRFFESLSLVHQALRQDPARLYSGMDFETRDMYRKAVEEIAASGQADELAVARSAVDLARLKADSYKQTQTAGSSNAGFQAGSSYPDSQPAGWDSFRTPADFHIGHYLLGEGRPALERAAKYMPRGWQRLSRLVRSYPTPVYLGAIAALTLLLITIPLIAAIHSQASLAGLMLVLVLALVPALTIAVDLVNWAFTQIIKPETLARMDFRKGLPQECAAVVVIPALLSGPDEVDSLLAQLELHYLRNPDPQLYFALLTDFTDSPAEHQPDDAELVQRARHGIRKLNEKYPRSRPESVTDAPLAEEHVARFALLQRERRWNPIEGVWMGWERKRGKLFELNRSILAAQGILPDGRSVSLKSSFPIHEGDVSFLRRVRYVITLDADTILPREAARELIAVLAHPLNRARLEPAGKNECGQKVTAGYTILQPRTEINPLSSNRSIFTRIFSGDSGLDLYTRAVSDVYQDLFGEGSYVGKGIYDIKAFELSLAGCIPENSLLSHDLLEGIHGRTALVTSATLIEDLPPTYLVHIRRLHRWIRGDWQLLPWLLSRRLSLISRWKILDNLRRSLVACSLLAWFVVGWLVRPLPPGVWTMAGVIVLAVPVVTGFLGALHRRISGQPVRQSEAGFVNSLVRWLLALAFIPYEALIAANAIVKTLVRLGITRRNLLNWTTSEQAVRQMKNQGLLEIYRRMYFGPLIALLLAGVISIFHPQALGWAAPLLAGWFLSPAISAWISRPLPRHIEQLDPGQKQELRSLALKTSGFHPTTFKRCPLGLLLTVPPPPISASHCFPPWVPTIWAIWMR